ncbi:MULTISPECIES: hypothetical protein [unclassified Streptomyces]|uniref:hypothetical protein n=1 Tax=unclassified Streptomyces TaxID=2593676 RepID=UPI00380422D1
MPADLYEWRTVPCPECSDPAARLVPGDGDRADILLCTRCPAHGRPAYRDPADVRAVLPSGAVLAMRDGVLCLGLPAAPHGLNAYTRSVVAMGAERGFLPVWRSSPRRHHVTLTEPGPDGAWGWMEVGARSGKILRGAIYPHGSRAPGTRAAGPHAVREMVTRLCTPGSFAG